MGLGHGVSDGFSSDCGISGVHSVALSVTVCIPWRPQPTRMGPYMLVRAFWESFGWPIIEADSDPSRHFNLAQARNNAVRQADTEIVVVSDADVIPSYSNVIEAVLTVGDEIVWPYTQHRYIPGDWTGDPFEAPVVQLDGMPPQPPEGYKEWTGSIYVATRQSYWRVGGFDERFTSWGGEDSCFRIAANTLVGASRIAGPCVSYNHECPGRNGAAQEGGNGTVLHGEYRSADLRPLKMLRLVGDPTRFLIQN